MGEGLLASYPFGICEATAHPSHDAVSVSPDRGWSKGMRASEAIELQMSLDQG